MQTKTSEAKSTRSTTIPWVLAFSLAVIVVVVSVVLLNRQSDPDPAVEPGSDDSIELSLGESNALASCLVFDTAILAEMPLAFQGTATAVEGSQVTLSVDRWFEGGDAATVTLVGGQESPALIAGFEFTPGDEYLISAEGGAVNYCGYSGASTPELLTAYETAFTG